MKLEYVIFFGPLLLAGIMVAIGFAIWRDNLGPTPGFWALIACAVVLLVGALALPIGIWLGDM